MMRAKKKPIQTISAQEMGIDLMRKTTILEVTEPRKERAGEKLESVDILIDKLVNEKKVLQEKSK